MSNYVIDFETTGLTNHPKLGHPQIIQAAYLKISGWKNFEIEETYTENFRPSMAIDPNATKVHGLTFRDVMKCRKSENFELPNDTAYLIAHNAKYEKRCLGSPGNIKFICTMELAKILKKQLGLKYENCQLETLTKFFFPKRPERLLEKHTALNDCRNTLFLLEKLLTYIPAIIDLEELYLFQSKLKSK